jgi:hypothetical protein
MRRRFIVLTLLPAGIALAVTAAVATPALAKGATRASITGPGLAHPVTVSATGEALPGEGDALSSLAEQTGLFAVLFGPDAGIPGAPSLLHAPPAAASLGPEYTVTYTVPGATAGPGQPDGQVRQEVYPRAAGGPVIYTSPGQQGFGSPLQATGWLRGTPQLTVTMTRLGIPASATRVPAPAKAASAKAAPVKSAPGKAPSAATPRPAGQAVPAWPIAVIASAAALAIAGTTLWLRRHSRPAAGRRARNPGHPADQPSPSNHVG